MAHTLPPFALETHFSRWEFTARHNLAASDVQSIPMSELLAMADDGARSAWDALRLGYTETRGLPALREAIAATYDAVSPADILCFAGAEEGIYVAMHALLGRDDHAITITPSYQSIESVPLSICEVTGIPLDPDRSWAIDPEQVRDALRPDTRLICINFPHNPTGAVIPRETLDAIVAMAAERGIHLFSDEVYRGLERSPDLRLPQGADLYERGLSLGVMSKAYGLAGLRIGWIATRDAALLRRMEEIKHYLSICNSAPSELLALIAVRARDRILARNVALVEENLALLDRFFRERAELFDWEPPRGGCIAYPRYLGAEGVELFANELVERHGVLVLPASIYRSALGPTPDDRFRIGFGRTGLGEGLAALDEYLTQRAGAS
jgi:aspartate/methionine/tyrosine aminotransferase